MASSRMTRRRQGSLPKSESPENDNDAENVANVVGKNNNVAVKRDFRLDDLEMVNVDLISGLDSTEIPSLGFVFELPSS